MGLNVFTPRNIVLCWSAMLVSFCFVLHCTCPICPNPAGPCLARCAQVQVLLMFATEESARKSKLIQNNYECFSSGMPDVCIVTKLAAPGAPKEEGGQADQRQLGAVGAH